MTTAEKKVAYLTQVDAYTVGWMFVKQYYTFLNQEPEKLHLFYSKNSYFVHGLEGESSQTKPHAHGQAEIQNAINNLGFENCMVMVNSVDSQESSQGGVVVMVIGQMMKKDQSCHKFCQTFFLAEQPKGYYVLNDIFRFLKDEVDDGYEERPASPVKQPEPVVAPRPPSPVKQQQKPPTPQESVAPPAPKSWANLVKPDAASTPAPAVTKPAPQQQPAPVLKKQESFSKSDDASNAEFKQVSSRKDRDSKRDQEKEKFSIYIRNVPTHVTRQMITEAAEQEFGPVRSVDIPTGKNMAFVEFASQETAARAIGHQMQVGGEALLAEERRKTGQNNGSNRGRFQGANYQGRGGNQNQQRGGRGGGAYAGRGREKGNANSSS